MRVQNVSIIKYRLFLSHFGTFAVSQPEAKQQALQTKNAFLFHDPWLCLDMCWAVTLLEQTLSS